MPISPIRIVIGGIDKFSGKFAKISANLERAGQKMSNVGRMATIGLTLPIAAMGASTLKTAANFESSMNRVSALSNATESQLDDLTKTARGLGATTVFSASEAADAMGFLAMAGFQTDKIIGAMPGTLNLAAAAQMDIARTADIASNILTGFGLKAEEMTRVADVMAKTMSTSNTNVEQLGEAMKFVAPVAGGMGIALEDTAAAIGLMGNAGIQGSLAGTQLRMALAKLAKPAGEAVNVMNKLGIRRKTLLDSAGNVRSFTKVIQELERAGASTTDVMTIFGVRAGPGILALMKQGGQALEDYRDSLDGAGGTAKRIADIQLKGLTGQLKQLRSAWEEFQLSIADSGLLEWITTLVGKLTTFVRGLNETNPQFLKFAVIAAGVVAAIGPMLFMLGQTVLVLTGILNMFQAIAVVVGTSTKAVAVFAGTVGLVIAALAIWAWNIYQIWKNWDAITSAFSSWEMFWKTMWFFILEIRDGLADIARIALPKWLEHKIGLSPAEGEGEAPSDMEMSNRIVGAGRSSESRVVVDFPNLPEGATVKAQTGDADVDPVTGTVTAGAGASAKGRF